MIVTQEINMTYTGAPTDAVDVSAARWGSVSVGEAAGSLGSGVLTIERSLNGVDWYGFGSAITVTGEGITDEIDLESVAYLRAKVTTAASGATARVTIYAEGA